MNGIVTVTPTLGSVTGAVCIGTRNGCRLRNKEDYLPQSPLACHGYHENQEKQQHLAVQSRKSFHIKIFL
jgi:hypothetical protein